MTELKKQIMKKLILMAISLVLLSTYAIADTVVMKTMETSEVASSGPVVVFRTTQKLTAKDGCQIYFYTNRVCKMYDSNGRLVVSCKYRLMDGEAFLTDDAGNEIYKGSYRMADGLNLAWVRFAGVYYYRK
ncbi:MAG: hypothetical protein IJZ92_01395 [Bacteroidaceae bacterium]|nr:hypothetical protein [Bacteroidaceae bacterium]